MDLHASIRFLRMAPRKVRLVARLIAGKTLPQAKDILQYAPRLAAQPLLKLLKSAEANAKNNHSLEPDTLRITKIIVDGGPVLKRYKPRAHGSADVIRKRSSHVELVLTELPKPKKEDKKKEAKEAKKELKKDEKKMKEEAVKADKKSSAKKPEKNGKTSEKVSKK